MAEILQGQSCGSTQPVETWQQPRGLTTLGSQSRCRTRLDFALRWMRHRPELVKRTSGCADANGGDFVTSLDARAIIERFGRRAGHRTANIALRSALVAEVAGTDLALAEKLSLYPLKHFLEAGGHPREHIWAAQVAVLFPLVERERQRLLKAHRNLWRVPHCRKNGTHVRRIEDLEIGDMANQVWSHGLLGVDHERLNWLRRVRNHLAHNEVVPWATLTTRVAVQIADFRD